MEYRLADFKIGNKHERHRINEAHHEIESSVIRKILGIIWDHCPSQSEYLRNCRHNYNIPYLLKHSQLPLDQWKKLYIDIYPEIYKIYTFRYALVDYYNKIGKFDFAHNLIIQDYFALINVGMAFGGISPDSFCCRYTGTKY